MNSPGGRASGWTVIIAQSLAFLLPLGVYIRTLARDITFVDSGELAAAAYHLGIAHPPGYPLYIMIGHLFTKLPIGTVAFRVGLLSAVCGAAATALLFRAVWMLVRREPLPSGHGSGHGSGHESDHGSGHGSGHESDHGSGHGPGHESDHGSGHEADYSSACQLNYRSIRSAASILAPLAVLAGVLLFALANTPWSQAVKVEVYALQGALLAALLTAAVPLLKHPANIPVPDAGRRVLLIGLLFGLGLAHHLTAMLSGIVLASVALHRARAHWPNWTPIVRSWLLMALGTALPLLLYLYLPLRSRMDPAINWNYPESWQRFWVHVSARQYHGLWGSQGTRWEELQRFLAEALPGEATIGLLVLGLLGLFMLGRRHRWIMWTSLSMTLLYVAYNVGYPIPDIADYYIPVILVVALWASYGAALGVTALSRRSSALAAGALALVMVVPAVTAVRNFSQRDLSDFQLTSVYARDVVANAREGGVIFSGSWEHFTGPMLYLQHVEGLRSDLVVLDLPSLSSPMLARSLERAIPVLRDACRHELEVIAEFASLAERGEEYNVVHARGLYKNLLRCLAQESVDLRPVYALSATFQHPMFEGLQRHPEGLLVRLTRDSSYQAFEMPRFELPVHLENEELGPTEKQLLSSYLSMVDGRVRYLEHHGRDDEAQRVGSYLDQIRR